MIEIPSDCRRKQRYQQQKSAVTHVVTVSVVLFTPLKIDEFVKSIYRTRISGKNQINTL